MQPIKMIFHLPQKDSTSLHKTEIEVIHYKTSETNLKISECYFETNNILLEIEHNEINTLIDFKNASDYQVLYLDENNAVNSGTYAYNNSIGFKIQTQSKKMLLMYRKPLTNPYKWGEIKNPKEYFAYFTYILSDITDEELVGRFNSGVRIRAWGIARQAYSDAIRNQFEKRGIDYSEVGRGGGLSYANKVDLVNNKMVIRKTDLKETIVNNGSNNLVVFCYWKNKSNHFTFLVFDNKPS